MPRSKLSGNLQLEKDGTWTARIVVHGERISKSTGTSDRVKAEAYLERLRRSLGLHTGCLPLVDAWNEYVRSPRRRDIAQSTLGAKRIVWNGFARWIGANYPVVRSLAEVSTDMVEEFLRGFRVHHSASTYNAHVCVLREIFRVVAKKAGIENSPWDGVKLLVDDSESRRELTVAELRRLLDAAKEHGPEWRLLVETGLYTGMRLGDCCRLSWSDVNLERGIIQFIPRKTKRHMHGKPVTVPIHADLAKRLREIPEGQRSGYVNPEVAPLYVGNAWRIHEAIRKIFKRAGIVMSERREGRARRQVVASFHSLRHTFVSLAANAGVPLTIVQSIVGHCSSAMTRHYYHENEDALRKAVAAIPSVTAQEVPK